MDLTAFECSLEAGVWHIVLNRPEQGNLFSASFCNELNVIANDISDRRDVRAVLISARGKFFSAGGDVGYMSGARPALPGIVKSLTSPLHMAIARLMQMNAPVVCAVQGRGAFGGAVALAAGADILIASEGAKFGAAFTGIGFSCDSGTTITLSQRLGIARTKRFLLMGETFAAQDALQAGLVDEVVPEDKLFNHALGIAQKLAQGPTLAFGEIKRLMMNVSNRATASQLEDEAQALARIAYSDDAWEGMTSFKEKRRPDFKGR